MKKQLFNLKNLVLILATGLLSMSVYGQMQIDNPGFENWDDEGTSDEEPVNWSSFMTADCTLGALVCGFAQTQHVEQSADAHSGTYSARIWSTAVMSIVANGNMTLGRVHMGSATPADASNYNYTDIADPDFNQALTDKPDSLVAWVKFNPQESTDKARVSATIHDSYNYRDPEDASATPHVVAHAELNYASTNGEWKRISIPFDYSGLSSDAQYILITFTANMTPGGGKADDEVFVDDVELIYNQNEVDISPIADQNLIENEAGTELTANETPLPGISVTSRQWKYSTTSGEPYDNDIAGEVATTYTPEFAAAGTYYVVCETDFDGDVVTSNEVIVNVTVSSGNLVSIVPNSTQNLIETQLGTELTASETPNAADSREWKYTTTSGSSYTSFSTTETGTTYTPMFDDAGTYYVVCVSDFGGGDIVTSNEVTVDVSEFTTSIDPSADQNIFENVAGTDLSVTEMPTADSREWKSSITSGSSYTSFSPAETGTTYTPQFSNLGTYYVVCESDIDGITVLSNEVTVVVVDSLLGIAENEIVSFAVYATDQKLNVDFSKVDIDNAQLRVLSVEGKVITKNALKGNEMNSIQLSVPTGIYFYSISNGKQFYQGKIFIK